MKRQWDTKKKFEPDYRAVAKIALSGWLTIVRRHEWRYALSQLADSLGIIMAGLLCIVLALVWLLIIPILLPAALIYHKLTRRRARLNYIRRNRAADRDI